MRDHSLQLSTGAAQGSSKTPAPWNGGSKTAVTFLQRRQHLPSAESATRLLARLPGEALGV